MFKQPKCQIKMAAHSCRGGGSTSDRLSISDLRRFFCFFVGYIPCMAVTFVWWIRNGSVLTSVAPVHASPSSFCHILDFCICESDCVELWVAAIQCAYYLPTARADTTAWLDTMLFQYSWAFVRQGLLHMQSVAFFQTCSSHPRHNWPSQMTWHWFEPPTKANPLWR